MSVPPDRMAVRQTGDPNRIMGLRKPVFWGIIVVGLFLAYWIYKRSKNTAAAGTAPTDQTQGLTSADIGGTPADNSFATNTDLTAIEEQIQQLQDSLFQLQQSNGGNGGGLPVPSAPGGGITNSKAFNPGNQSSGGQMTTDSGTGTTDVSNPATIDPTTTQAIGYFGPGGGGQYTTPIVTAPTVGTKTPTDTISSGVYTQPAYKSGTALAY